MQRHRQHRYTPPIDPNSATGPDASYLRRIRAEMELVDSMPASIRRAVHERGMIAAGIEAVTISRTAAAQQAAYMAKRRATRGHAARYVAPKIDGWNYGD